MKKLVLLIMIFVAASSFAQDTLNTKLPISNKEHKKQDIFIRENIVGKWKDQNSTLYFYSKGSYFFQHDSGGKDSGYWRIKKSKLILTRRPSHQEDIYKLHYFSKTNMDFQMADNKQLGEFIIYMHDPTIWMATKIENFDK